MNSARLVLVALSVALPVSVVRALVFVVPLALCLRGAADTPQPNIIVILADDLGWHDLGAQGATDLMTPNIDSLAANGVRFTSGYVTAPVCSPSRAGLMTGRYQQRFGHETNPGPALEHSLGFGLPVTESTMGNRLKALGYATGWIGKSHLGAQAPYHPNLRGFDDFFGFLESHHDYLNPSASPKWDHDPIQRNGATVTLSATDADYLTSVFTRGILTYIDAHAAQPFFLYAPFNAVHFPLQSTAALKARIPDTMFPGNPMRREMARVLLGLDDAVGAILAKLEALHLEENTLIFFTSDNGGDISSENGAINLPLRGGKTQPYEGGLRVPFFVQWKGHLTAGRVIDSPVSTLDILPTAVAAAGGTVPAAWQLDGVNLLPLLLGQTSAAPHPTLFWRIETDGLSQGPDADVLDGIRAVRRGNWKLVKNGVASTWELYDLSIDIGETNNRAADYPDIVQQLVAAWDAWSAQMARPRWAAGSLDYATPDFVLEDIRIGAANVSYLDPAFLPGGAQVAFHDSLNSLWRGDLDPVSGFLRSGHGQDQSVDTNVAPLAIAANGAKWGLSASGSALYYTKPGSFSHQQVWRAQFGNTITRTQLTASQTNDNFGVRVSQEPAEASVKMVFNAGSTASSAAVWADETSPLSAAALPFHAGGLSNGRWMPGTADLAYSGHPPAAPATTQIARLRTATGTPVMISNDAGGKTDVWGFIAPEFGELCYAAVVDHNAIAIYRDPHTAPNNIYDREATLTLPATSPPRFLYSMKPLQGLRGFNGTSYFSCVAYANNDPLNPGTAEMWLLGLGPDPSHRFARRVDEGTGADRSDPITVIGEREVFFYYTRNDEINPAQLRLASTGLTRPDYPHAPTGFTGMQFNWSFKAGVEDVFHNAMNGIETTHLVAHDGKLFAAQGSTGSDPLSPSFTGAQFLVKDSASAPWRVDRDFTDHISVEAMEEITFTTKGPVPLGSPEKLLVASLRDITSLGSQLVSVRSRVADGQWNHSGIPDAGSPGFPTSFGSHLDEKEVAPVHYIYAGLSNGEIHRGMYAPATTQRLDWSATPPQTPNPELSGTGPVTSFAEANGLLYAACGIRQANSTAAITGGLYVRNDATNAWLPVYRWSGPLPLYSAPVEKRVMTGLTAVPDPRGAGHEVLLGARSWPGVIERIDPARGFTVTVELDVRDFFARRWHSDSVRLAPATIGYTSFTPVTNPVTGEQVHLVSLWIEHPDSNGPPHNGSHLLIRHLDATYEAADIENFAPALPSGQHLRATRCIAASPFAVDGDSAFYFGGYDTAAETTSNTAWIMRGGWLAWPELTITQPDPPAYQLTWPVTGNDWQLETSSTLDQPENWSPVPGLPARSLTLETQSVSAQGSRSFFRLRKR